MHQNCYIAPSILSADFANLGQEIADVAEAGADLIHIDVIDGNFAPNISFGACVIRAIRPLTNLIFDTHLMIQNCDNYIEEFAKAGSDIITIHSENNYHLHRSVQLIKQQGKKAGLALNPATPVAILENLLDYIDMILVMSVNPGFSGQSFITSSLNKIKNVKALIGQRPIAIEVDGGVNEETIGAIASNGANIFVAGSYIFNKSEKSYKEKITTLRSKAFLSQANLMMDKK